MRKASLLIFVIVAIAASASSSSAQTRKKPRPLATPLPTITGAEIISQASDSAAEVQVIPEPTPTPRRATTTSARLNELNDRVKRLETGTGSDADAKQKRTLLNLDILNRAEQRADSLRKQVFDMIEKENSVKKRLDDIAYEMQPEVIERMLQLGGSLRPEAVRENRRKQLAAEQANLQSLLSQVQATRASLEGQLAKAEDMVEKLRTKLEKDINDSFLKDDEPVDKPDEDQP